MSLLGRTSLRVASVIRLSSLAPRVVAAHRVQVEPPRRTMALADRFPASVKKTLYNMTGHNKYGLYNDDMYVEDEDVLEALRRLPPQLQVLLFAYHKLASFVNWRTLSIT